ncbi:MAG TPA: hypothetical protein PKC60_04575 [Hydrogenophaga sp.]|uniref:hypothetical protein n=1 Tax=Hydrogenophaga sp. TaxID=1904254 RepID=UPI002CD24E7B|nr:hypothetical protein [Hydrogenophaga sp.]HMN92487.1 hypothetical protein [Hydrogenophaga sp.]HMP10475.1 hypothetical protein [Hydrogenophaga sp.]
MMNPDRCVPQSWLQALELRLDELEKALLSCDAMAVQASSHAVQQLMIEAPATRAWSDLPAEQIGTLQRQARRFAGLRQAVLRLAAQSERATRVLLPEKGLSPTYAPRQATPALPGRGYLSA